MSTTPPLDRARELADRARDQAAEIALLQDRVAAAEEAAAQAGEIGLEQRASLRRAATHATAASAGAVHAMYQAAGGSAVYDSSPLQRHFRDVHVATQHMAVAPATWELAGRVALGLTTDASQLVERACRVGSSRLSGRSVR